MSFSFQNRGSSKHLQTKVPKNAWKIWFLMLAICTDILCKKIVLSRASYFSSQKTFKSAISSLLPMGTKHVMAIFWPCLVLWCDTFERKNPAERFATTARNANHGKMNCALGNRERSVRAAVAWRRVAEPNRPSIKFGYSACTTRIIKNSSYTRRGYNGIWDQSGGLQ